MTTDADVKKQIDEHFPQVIAQKGPVTMQQLGDMKSELKKHLPKDSIVELTLLMQTICLSAWWPGKQTDRYEQRTCEVKVGEVAS